MAFFGNQPPQSTRLDELKRILQKDPTSRQFLALAEEYRRQGKLRDAIITLERGLQIHGTSVAAHVSLGKTYQQLDRLEDATRAFINALRIDRENLVAIRQLAEVYLSKGDKVEAIKKLKLYRGLKPGDKDVNELIVQIEAEMPSLRDTGSSGSRPHPAPVAAASPSSARRAALRLRAEPARSGTFSDAPAARPGLLGAPPPPPDFLPHEGAPADELYASGPTLEKMWEGSHEEAPTDDHDARSEVVEKISGSPPTLFRPPEHEPPPRPRPPSRDLMAMTYEMPIVEETISPPPATVLPASPAPAPADISYPALAKVSVASVSPSPAPSVEVAPPLAAFAPMLETAPEPVREIAAAPVPESAPFEDVPASAPVAVPDFFDVSTETFDAAPGDVPVLSAPSFEDVVAPADPFDDPPTQPLFLEPPVAESRAPRVPSREMPRMVSPDEGVAAARASSHPAPSRLRSLAARFPARTSVALEDLRGCLQSLVAKAEGVRAAVLTDMEGLPVLTVGRAGEKADAHVMEILVAEMTSFLKSVRRTRDEVGEGALSSLTLVGERGAAVVARVSNEYSLILHLDAIAAVGEARYEAARTADTLRLAVG